MAEQTSPGIYLIVEFDWPSPMRPELVQRAKDLHQIVQNQFWIQEAVAAVVDLGQDPVPSGSSGWKITPLSTACSATDPMKSREPTSGSSQKWQT